MSNAVRLQSKAVQAIAGDWTLLDGLMGGTRAMRTAGAALLPQFPAEDDGSYSARLKTAVLTNFFGRTASIMASKPFSQEINLTGLSAPIVELLGDVDGQGSELQEFGVALLRACMSHGVAGVLVDCPPAKGLRTKADEQAAQIRPYWCMYPAATILGCKACESAVNGH